MVIFIIKAKGNLNEFNSLLKQYKRRTTREEILKTLIDSIFYFGYIFFYFRNCKNPIYLLFLNIQVIAIVLRLFFNFALKLSLTASSFSYLILTLGGILMSLIYLRGMHDNFSLLEALESIFGGFLAGIFWLRTREINSRLFFKLKIFYLIIFTSLWSFLLLLLFYKLEHFLNFDFL